MNWKRIDRSPFKYNMRGFKIVGIWETTNSMKLVKLGLPSKSTRFLQNRQNHINVHMAKTL